MRQVTVCVATALLCLICATALHAQQPPPSAVTAVPRLVRVTGTIVPADGQPAAPVESVTLAIYADETGGAPLWQETQDVAVGADGRYSVLLGGTLPDGLPLDLFASGEARWLGRRFERAGEGEQARVRLATVPYALKASDADTLGGLPPSAYVLAQPGASAGAGATNAGAAGIAVALAVPVVAPLSSGTPGYIGKFVSPTDLGNSAIYDSGSMVGVNTTTPKDFFNVRFTDTGGTFTGYAVQNLGSTSTSYSGMLFFDQNGALGQFQGFNNSTHEYRINNIASGGTINFLIGSTSRFKVANNGYVGIGNPSPDSLLHVGGGGSPVVKIEGSTNTAGLGPKLRWTEAFGFGSDYGMEAFFDGGTDSLIFRGLTDGEVDQNNILVIRRAPGFVGVGIGTAAPADMLQVVGDLRVGTGTTGCVKDADGSVIAGTCSSDRRFKKNITPFARSLEKISLLQPVQFSWRADEYPDRHFGTSHSFGLIAQDVEAVLPELVTTDEEGYEAVRYSALPMYMLQAIKELKAENDALKARLQAQDERLRKLERGRK
jgi:hypothetical protein